MKLRSLVLLLTATLVTAAVAPASAESPQTLYTLNCWGCHRPNAEGIPGTVPRLAGSMGYFLHIPEGRAYLVEVPGVASSPLTDAEVAEVVNWLLVTFSKDQLPKDFVPYTAAEVAKHRHHQLVNITQVRLGLAQRLQSLGLKVSTR